MSLQNFILIIRPLNLFIIALTMYTTRYAIINPLFGLNEIELVIHDGFFALMVASIVMITAYGYIINDMGDIKSDEINSKKRVNLSDKEIYSKAQNISFILLLIGLFCGFVSGFLTNNSLLLILLAFIAFSVWFYSRQLKRFVFVDNLIVAFLCGLIPLLVAIFDLPISASFYHQEKFFYLLPNNEKVLAESFYIFLFNLCLMFGIFGFLITLKREIIKDIEDLKGDRLSGYNSIALQFGERYAYKLAMIVGFLIIALIIIFMIYAFRTNFGELERAILLFFIFTSVVLPVAQSLYLDTKKNAKGSSKYLKICMIGGICSVILIGILLDYA